MNTTTTTVAHPCVGRCLTLIEQASHLSVGGAVFLSVCVLAVAAIVIVLFK